MTENDNLQRDKVDKLLRELEETATQIKMEAETENPQDMMAISLAEATERQALTTLLDRRMKKQND